MNPIKVLVVDDDSIVRNLLVTFLRFHEFEAKAARSGEEAMQILDRERFQVVITDLIMGKVNGHEVVRFAKGLNPATLLILITGNCQEENFNKAIECGTDDFFCKPLCLEDILKSLPSPAPSHPDRLAESAQFD